MLAALYVSVHEMADSSYCISNKWLQIESELISQFCRVQSLALKVTALLSLACSDRISIEVFGRLISSIILLKQLCIQRLCASDSVIYYLNWKEFLVILWLTEIKLIGTGRSVCLLKFKMLTNQLSLFCWLAVWIVKEKGIYILCRCPLPAPPPFLAPRSSFLGVQWDRCKDSNCEDSIYTKTSKLSTFLAMYVVSYIP